MPQLDSQVLSYAEVYELVHYSDIWNVNYYGDNIHPNAEGAAALAEILKNILGQ